MTIFLYIKVFFFIFAILCIIRDTFNLLKVIKLKEGKLNMNTSRMILLASSISYVLTMIILGF